MTQIILVHGACHGAWCWRDVIPGLTARGHDVVAIDMPGRGVPGPGCADLTLADQADAILAVARPGAVLVGHSAGGFSISAAAERAPDMAAHLVYVAALLPGNGDNLNGMMQGLTGERASIPILRTDNKLGYIFDTNGAGPALYNGADPADMDWALTRVCAEPSGPHRDKIALGDNFASVAKSYVLCHDDRVIPGVDQARMAQDLAQGDIYDLATGHSPFLSEAPALIDIIDKIAKAT